MLGPVATDDAGRRRFATQVRDLRELACDVEPDADGAARAVASADADRLRAGMPPLVTDEEPPEIELHRRASALGLRRIRR